MINEIKSTSFSRNFGHWLLFGFRSFVSTHTICQEVYALVFYEQAAAHKMIMSHLNLCQILDFEW